jgi:hypothetical protein
MIVSGEGTEKLAGRPESRLAARTGRPTVLLLLIPIAMHAQLALVTFDGTTESPVGATYSYGTVSNGDTKDVRFRARNVGNSKVDLTTLTISGTGFSILAVNGVVPSPIAPTNFLEFTIRFGAALAASYSANLQVNSISVLLLATAVPAPEVTVFPACLPGSTGGVDFPSVAMGTTGGCIFSLRNPSAQPLLISTLSVTGDAAFQGPQNLATPLTLRPNDAITFTVQFTPVCGTLNYAAMLNVNTRSYPLAGVGLTAPLPKPLMTFDTAKIGSGEQHTISMILPSPAACASSGNLNLAFTGVAGDQSVFFLSGSAHTLPFSVKAKDTQISINGQASAPFQTGTTAGTITFTLNGTPIGGDATTKVTIPPAPIAIETASASNQRAGELDITVTGYDNTYSAGAMSFTFFDTGGNVMGSAIAADFTSNFKSFFSGATTGSAFLMRVSFPVIGNQLSIGKVQVNLTNSAGQAQTGSLTFQ